MPVDFILTNNNPLTLMSVKVTLILQRIIGASHIMAVGYKKLTLIVLTTNNPKN
jgi:hypothetical protein